MQTLVINRQDGNITKSLSGKDHISGLLFLKDNLEDLPEALATTPYAPCSSPKSMEALGIVAESAEGYQITEALRTCPGITLWIGFALRTDQLDAVSSMQHAASGNIRQLGIMDSETEVSKAAITALQTQATALDNEWMPLSIILAPKVSSLGSLPKDLAASAPNVSVLISRDSEASEPALGTLIGTLAARSVNESIACVQECETGLTSPVFSDGTPYSEVDKARLEELDEARYIYLRTYPSLNGVYFSDSHNMAAASSDYNSIETERTMDKAVRGTRTYLLPELGRPLYFNSDGTLRADTLQHLRTVAGKAVEDMERAGEVSGWKVDIDPAQDVLGTSTVEFTIQAVPVGIMRRATVNIGYTKSL